MDLLTASGSSGAYQQSHRYVVLLGALKIGFSKVSGLKYSMPMEPLKVGGLDRPVMVRSQHKASDHLIFEHGMYSSLLKRVPFIVGLPLVVPLTVVTLTENWGIGRIFCVLDPVVESWELSELNAKSGEVLIEKFSVYHSGIFEG